MLSEPLTEVGFTDENTDIQRLLFSKSLGDFFNKGPAAVLRELAFLSIILFHTCYKYLNLNQDLSALYNISGPWAVCCNLSHFFYQMFDHSSCCL